VVLSEALSNAIVRGNGEDSSKWVDVRAELGPEAIRVYVTDEGPGFDPTAVPEPISPEQLDEAQGRGLYLIRKLVDAVHFNEQGNSICMILRRS
jgi:serine/threonine-protein kinase RsbW